MIQLCKTMMISFSLFKQLALNVAVTVFTSRKLVKSCLNPKRISYSTELMVQMLNFLKMSHDLGQHKCTFAACKIANPYIFD